MEEEGRKVPTEVEPSGPGTEEPNPTVWSTNNSPSTSQLTHLSRSKTKSKSKSKTTKKKKTTRTDDDGMSTVVNAIESCRVKTDLPKTKKKKRKKKNSADEVGSLDHTSSTYSDDGPKKSLSKVETDGKTHKEKKEKKRNVIRTKSFETKKNPKHNVNRSKSFDEVGNSSLSSLSRSQFYTSKHSDHVTRKDGRGGRGGRGDRGRGVTPPGRDRARVGAPTTDEKRFAKITRERNPIQKRVSHSRSHSADSTSIESINSIGSESLSRSRSRSRSESLSLSRSRSRSRGRYRSGDETYTLQVESSHRTLHRPQSKPKSILRKSSHHRGILHHSSHHTISSQSKHNRRVIVNLGPESEGHKTHLYSGFDSDVESDSNGNNEVDDDDDSFAMEEHDEKLQKNDRRALVKSLSQNMKQSINSFMTMDLSGHSPGLGTASSHRTNALSKPVSQKTVAHPEFEDNSRFIAALRYIRFLAPHPNEHPIKKKIRIVTWLALFLDFLNALVAIITYGGETTQCCKKSIMSAFGGGVDWDETILVVTSLYMLLIFMEVLPVMRDAFPFNLFNPFIGFLITFAVFFSDSIMEAAIMWTVEALAVGCEVFSYRLRIQLFGELKTQLKQTKREIQKLRRIKRKVKDRYENGKVLVRAGSDDLLDIDLEDEDFDGDESFFVDDTEMQKCNGDIPTATGHSTHTTMSDIGNFRETRLLRERRQLMTSQAEDERDLHYHLIGVSINVFLVILSLLMIVIIAKNGGMCIKGMQFGNIFKNNQLDKCYKYKECENPADCEDYCPRDENGELTAEAQCYYPYGIGL